MAVYPSQRFEKVLLHYQILYEDAVNGLGRRDFSLFRHRPARQNHLQNRQPVMARRLCRMDGLLLPHISHSRDGRSLLPRQPVYAFQSDRKGRDLYHVRFGVSQTGVVYMAIFSVLSFIWS